MGHIITSRAEGAHTRLKSCLESSTENLLTTFEKIEDAHSNEYREITTQIYRRWDEATTFTLGTSY